MNAINRATLLESKLELHVLQSRRPRTPEEHRELSERIVHAGTVIALIEKQERDNELVKTRRSPKRR